MRQRLLGLMLLAWGFAATAHDARPVVVDIRQLANQVEINIRIPASLPVTALPEVSLAADCQLLAKTPLRHLPGAYLSKHWLRCMTPVANSQVRLHYPDFNPSLSALLKVSLSTGEEFSHLLGPAEQEWRIPAQETAHGVALKYAEMGMLHIWEGWDHLLFVLCLILLADSLSNVLVTVTGFTLGHSITLVAASLGVIQVPVVLFETLIALSIVFLAAELANRRSDSWTIRYPVIVSACFGLLHGLGFASVLSKIGLPQIEVFWGLLSFNLGIEFGQLVFVVFMLLMLKALKLLPGVSGLRRYALPATISAFGIVSAYWFWDRSLGLFSGGVL